MKVLMMLFAVACWGFAALVSQSIASDIQLILMALGIIGGGIFVGIAAVLIEIGSLRNIVIDVESEIDKLRDKVNVRP